MGEIIKFEKKDWKEQLLKGLGIIAAIGGIKLSETLAKKYDIKIDTKDIKSMIKKSLDDYMK